ncbi:TIGR04442 family protein [Geothermobacter hydrogeniphilus]|uniref:TIGR04442 family protein n=1 Tax=Geothermobacter hydrogeniphilus TaxID=1969733 RepID=A0A1X0Y835_9BACT|nr:TIGR04442 family protein [Geothermobacter hydrogeniphilus]ORJ61276.1 TIGR04442 family protein [Geothermobacter hydrogeniphilus]
MHQEIRLHGHLDETIEYFASVAGRDVRQSYFYEQDGHGLRIFSPGNEFVLSSDGISHRGNGGSFCEYMFGVDQPLADLAKGDIRNRLALYGATYSDRHELLFTDRTDGSSSYDKIFLEGNAVCNYFFFLSGSVSGRRREQQEEIARLLGKQLKRSPHVQHGDDIELLDELMGYLGHRSALYLIKLIHKRHKAYHDTFAELYFADKSISEEDYDRLRQLAEDLQIDRYQQERIRIDVMYKHPDNRRIVDEYRSILIDCNLAGEISTADNARLTRLKTLSVRNKIPSALFYTLDEMLKHDKLVHLDEKDDYLAETRQILEGILLQDADIDAGITNDDMLRLLDAKRQASENRDHQFEQLLLETGKACDERIRDGADLSLLESFSRIVTFFDRYDSVSAHISQLAFMEGMHLGEEAIRSLLGNRNAFEELDAGLFDRLFFLSLLDNKYLGRYGRTKVEILRKGLAAIADGSMTIQELLEKERRTAEQERLYHQLLDHVKDRIRNFYSRYNTRAEQEALRREISEEFTNKGLYDGDIPKGLFRDVVVNIKKEAIYLHNLLPEIVAARDASLREDFLDNSGLDRFYVEELEREYFELNQLNPESLNQIRKGLNP